MMRMSSSPQRSQRGAVLIHVAIALLGLVAFTTFVVDYGIMWASRGQAQTAADAGALAGALALSFDSRTDFDGAKEKARAVAIANLIFGQPPDVQIPTGKLNGDVTFPPCPPNTPGLPDTCVKVDVYRNQARGNALPTFFGNVVGIGAQGVRATATAQIVSGTQTDCLKPWAILDRWDEYNAAGGEPDYPNADPDFDYSSTFDKYSDGKGQSPAAEPDMYVPPSASGAGTGFRLPADQGRRFAVKVGDSANQISSGWFRAIRIPRLDGQTGGNVYRSNIESCGGLPNGFASPTTVCPANIGNADAAYWATQGCYAVEPGNMVGPTGQGVDTLIARDPSATWGANGITGSNFSPATSSPRVVPIGVIDIDQYLAADPTGSNGIVKLVNIYGFFIEGMGDVDANGNVTCCSNGGKSVVGRIMTIPSIGTGTNTLASEASFLNQVILVR
jgi:Flp pilus assembly protein TadG